MKKLEHEKLLDKRKKNKDSNNEAFKYQAIAKDDLSEDGIRSEDGRTASTGDRMRRDEERLSHNLNKSNADATTDFGTSEFTETVLDRRELE